MDERRIYRIEVKGQVDERDLNARSPVEMTLVHADTGAMHLIAHTDQSGLIGLMRHLHERGTTILVIDSK